jgi:hypothetical protein
MPSLLSAQESKKEGDKAKGPPKEIAVDLGGGMKLKMVLIPAGGFKMGSGESAEATAAFFNKTYETYGEDFLIADSFKDEHPQHRVRITKPFRSAMGCSNPDDALAAAFQLDMAGDWDAAVALYGEVARRCPGHEPYTQGRITGIDEKRMRAKER